MERITWDQFFLAQSHLLALRSTCTRLAVGATIVRDRRIMAGGYNGSISGGDHCIDHGCYVVDNHCVRTIHAEMNALITMREIWGFGKWSRFICDSFSLSCLVQNRLFKRVLLDFITHRIIKITHMPLELLEQADVEVIHVPFDERKIDFLSDEKVALYMELITKLREKGASSEELAPYETKVAELFGRITIHGNLIYMALSVVIASLSCL